MGKWEGDLGENLLGDDYVGRFKAIEVAVRRGLLGQEALTTVITREQIAGIVRRLNVQGPEQLIDQLWSIAGRHLRPVHRKLLGSDAAATSKLLGEIAQAAAELEASLDSLPPITRDFLDECFVRIQPRRRSQRALDINALDLSLTDLIHTTVCVQDQLRRRRKRPAHVLLRQTLWATVLRLEDATGNKASHTWSKGGEKFFRFHDEPGTALRDFMKLVEPQAAEAALVRTLIEIRKRQTHPKK